MAYHSCSKGCGTVEQETAVAVKDGDTIKAVFENKAFETQIKETLTVTVPKTSIKSLTKAVKAFTVKWDKKSVTGYQIQYATNSKFTKGKKTIRITKASTVSKKVSKLKSGKKYYVRVRCYIDKCDKTYTSVWTAKKSVVTK